MLRAVKVKKTEEVIENKEESKVKIKWSLKKKLLVGAGVVATAVVGVLAYGSSKKNECTESNEFGGTDDDDDEDCEDAREFEDESTESNETNETQE